MIGIALGIIGFVLYFAYDINSIRNRSGVLQKFFLLGSICVLVSTIEMLIQQWQPERLMVRLVFLTIFVVFGILEVYTLFFALPFEETYVEDNKIRPVYKEGVYALCRHPGVLWFIGVYVGIWGFSGRSVTMAVFCILMSVLDIIYVVLQDLWIFPETFSDYNIYKKETPFLIPTPKSVGAAFRTRR